MSRVPRLVWTISATGLLVPWLSGAGVKIYLDMKGAPTWPWSQFLNPLQWVFLLPATVWISLPFFVLAYAARKLLPRDFAGLVSPQSRRTFFVGGLVLGAIGAVRVFVGMFWEFSFWELMMPVWLDYLPYMLAGLALGYVAGRLAGRRAAKASGGVESRQMTINQAENSRFGRRQALIVCAVVGIGLLAWYSQFTCSSSSTPLQTPPSQTLVGHSEPVSAVAWSPDGRRVASTGLGDYTVRIWDVTATNARVLRHNSRWVQGAAWSPAGNRLATWTFDSVYLWEPDTGRQVGLILGNNQEYDADHMVSPDNGPSAVWSPGGETMALPGWADGAIRLVDGRTGDEKVLLRGHSGRLSSVAWSPDGSRLASGAWDSTVRFWSVAARAQEKVLSGFDSGWIEVAWSPDGRLLASHQFRGEVRLWNTSTGAIEHVIPPGVSRMAWSPDGKRLATAAAPEFQEGRLCVWNALTGEREATLDRYFSPELEWSPDGQRLAVAGLRDSYVSVWNVNTREETRFPRDDGVTSIAWDPKGRRLASGGINGSVYIWEIDPATK